MLEKIKTYQDHPVAKELRDIRALGLIAFGIIVLLVSWSGVRVIETNYRLQQQIARLQEQNKLTKLENQNRQLQNEYYRTDQYLELQARKNFGKAAPGETLVLVPEHVALSRTADLNPDDTDPPQKIADKPFYQKNFEAWLDFFFHRESSDSSSR